MVACKRVHSPEAYQTASYDIAAGHREAVDAKLTSGGSKKKMVGDGQRRYFGKRMPTHGAPAEVPYGRG